MRWYKILPVSVLACFLLSGCSIFKRSDDQSDRSADRLYSEANTALKKNRYQTAIELYQSLESRFPYGPYAEQAQLEIGYAYFKNGEPDAAIAAAERFVRLHPTHPSVDYAYYLKGLINFNNEQGIFSRFGIGEVSDRDPRAGEDSFDAFRDLVNRFPESRYADDSRQRMAFLLNTLAQHDIQVADYYMRRGAYVAVVNRCKHVVENYQRTPSVEDALGMLAIAYRRMGMEKLAQDSVMILETNFPNSAYLSRFEGTSMSERTGLFKKTTAFFKKLF